MSIRKISAPDPKRKRGSEMAAYQLIMIIAGIFVFGALFAAIFDPIEILRFEYVGMTTDFENNNRMMWFIFSALTPLAVLSMLGIYGIATTQKRG